MSPPAARRASGGDILVALLEEHGVECAFGVVSVHNLPLVEAIERRLRFVPVRHEAAAVNAADGYARAGGAFGVAITSTGTGAGNAAGSLVEALTAGSRVLHVTGQIESEFLGAGRGVIHEVPRQPQMLAAVSRFTATVRRARDARRVLREAIDDLLTAPYAPASVEWPIDLQYAASPADQDGGAPPSASPGPAPVRDGAALARAARLLTAAERPLIWAGGGARSAGPALGELAERLGAGLLTSNAGRGTVPEDHELVLGNFAARPELAPLIADADLLLSIGTHFRSNETRHYGLEPPRTHVQIDLDPAAIGRVYPVTEGIAAEAAEALPALLAALGPPVADPAWRRRVIDTRARARRALGEEIGAYREVCASLRARLPRASVVARDVTIPSSSWGNRLLEIYDSRTNIFPLGGGIGQGLAMGIGAALARPDAPTAVLAGDGGLAVHLGELATLAEAAPWCVLIVFNDGGYGVLRNMQDEHVGRRSGVDLLTPDFALLAASVGLPYELALSAAQFDAALEKALALRAPFVLEVDVTALSPAPRPFVPPVHVPHTTE
ncbi:thiamine pyrophosphate-binding protein [Actinomadura macra]|uniref:thiamine pyrophosphate-binding protein n=1 Tax=Actinomadura macra TaxID=46164 RepID=UPI00082970AC|nr:thiamine pyrophosphate-binding protein [Actinomadura macra]